jgi:hypothetical protein
MGAPDSALPVFSFRPNWGVGVTEHLEWMTDVLTSPTEAEQRIALRLTPRRLFSAQIEPIDEERTFLDLFIRGLGQQEFMLPLWHDHAALDAPASAGATTLSFDTTDREFVDGGMAILMGADAMNCEAVQIDTVASGALTLSTGTAAAWAAGTTIHPLRRSWLRDTPKMSRQTDSFDVAPMEFLLSGAQSYDGGTEDLATFDGYPILSPAPNWSATLDLELLRNLDVIDGKVGLRSVYDPAGRGFNTQMHRWMLNGRAEQAAFRRLLYRLAGKPTFGSDLIIAGAASPGATHIDVKQCGLAYTAFPAEGRDHAITADGEVLTFTGPATLVGPGVERIALSTALVAGLAVGDSLSFLDIGRLDSDTIDIHHETDSDGVATVEVPFRTFPNVRDGSADGADALPAASMTSGSCGAEGWQVHIRFEYMADPPSPPTGYDNPLVVVYTPGNPAYGSSSAYAVGGAPIAIFDYTPGEVNIYLYFSVATGATITVSTAFLLGDLQAPEDHPGTIEGTGVGTVYVNRVGALESVLEGPKILVEYVGTDFSGSMP